MQMKLGVFGRKEWIERLKEYTERDSKLDIVPFELTHSEEAMHLVDDSYMCDIYLFIGSLPYLYARETIVKKRLPTISVSMDEYMILTSFYRVKHDHGERLDRFSIDVLNSEHVSAILGELDITDRDIYTYSYMLDEASDVDKIADFHRTLWEKGAIDYVLTSVEEVKEDLSASEIPTYLMEIPRRNIIKAIEEAKQTFHFNQSISAQVVAGYIGIKNAQALGNHSKQEAIYQLHQLLLEFAHRTYATVLPHGENQFVLFGTRGTLDHITNHYRDLPLLKDVEASLDVSVEIGFGLGMTTKEAEDHAKLALEVCHETNESSCYIVNERQDIIGPLGVEKHVDTSKLYQALIHRARLNNELSYNFIDFIKRRNNEPFSSADIAEYYRVTKRSAERTINKLKAGKVIIEAGHEKPYIQGRPRKLFTVSI